ncbi:hypothetical protein DVA67_009345 [Solirubrobacter sp. CPCC 204708]|uniref:CARDB domain-containing protein n=1 Tax=Solirubrobacter deserti TaxID=2282478 RepID=A0ABT4RU79_9ACTN|nr:hypothetical protein [Solirubrobacter deserti]MBE2316179.1 hypothetical protein [Solirubrobacter deserti]MDA0141805.1 hypothetical protein [Solirubrobacter deserti]
MKLVRSRLVAGALGLAVAGAATGSVIARADESAPVAQAAQQGGVSITPATVERTAKRGAVGTITIKNTTKDTMRVTVNVRPWIQNRNTGAVALNTRASLSPYVRASPQTFNLRPGERRVTFNMRRMTASGSLYAGFQVFAKQTKAKARNGIIPQWDLRGKMRLNPTRKNPNLRIGAADVVGRGNNRSLILAVRNTGNTLDPVGGTVSITGPTSRNATIPQVGVVPGQVVYLKGGALRGMRAGNYTATWNVTIGGKRFTQKRTFRL